MWNYEDYDDDELDYEDEDDYEEDELDYEDEDDYEDDELDEDIGDFYRYVRRHPHKELIEAIQREYLRVKNNCIYAPALGVNGCLEFAGALLLHVYITERYSIIKRKSNSEQEKEEWLQKLMSVGIVINCAFLGAAPLEFSNMADEFPKHTGLLTRREWSEIYLYLRDYHADDIRKLEFNLGNKYSCLADREKTIKVITNAKRDIGKVINYFISYGLII